MTDALTPAQVEFLTQWLEDRQARLLAASEDQVREAVDPLKAQVDALQAQVAAMQEALAVLDGAVVKLGASIALRASAGKLLAAREGGPTLDGEPVVLEARTTVGPWESFRVEPGQG
jgi:hypothetical protein